MVSIPGIDPAIMWVAFLILVAFFLFLDLGVINKKHHKVSIREALTWTVFWISLALLFNAFIWMQFGHEAGLQFLAGYLLEESLSIDNIFVIFLIFTSFKIAAKYQHRILFWGIIGLVILRGGLILLGSALVQAFDWIFFIFGLFLLYSGVYMALKKEKDYDPHNNWIVRLIRKIMPVARNHKGRFFVKSNGKTAVTILFIALIVVEATDLVFALDSIPAIFGITKDPFIVFTSNIFAILGLRSLYFVIARIHELFKFLKYGLAAILVFIGLKMILEHFIHISLAFSLGMVFFLLFTSILSSIIFTAKKQSKNHSKQ